MSDATATAAAITRPEPGEYAAYYAGYISQVPDGDVVGLLRTQIRNTLEFLAGIPEGRAGHRYAPGKWSIREVVGHMCDVERIMAYRALRIARGDRTPLPGFDENAYVPAANFDARTLDSLAGEFTAVRRATVAFLETLDADAALRRGTANNLDLSARAIAYIIAGHERHHVKILRERYLKQV
jgi:uncharacterized damage-inducible protein DinB